MGGSESPHPPESLAVKATELPASAAPEEPLEVILPLLLPLAAPLLPAPLLPAPLLPAPLLAAPLLVAPDPLPPPPPDDDPPAPLLLLLPAPGPASSEAVKRPSESPL